MSIFHGMNISASGLTTQRLRMDIASSNIANGQTTRAKIDENGDPVPYRRKMAVVGAKDQHFKTFLQKAENKSSEVGHGVKVNHIVEDPEPFKLVYNPKHPDANEDGYVRMPNVNLLKEMTDLMEATRSYEANITSLNATKNMMLKALKIGN